MVLKIVFLVALVVQAKGLPAHESRLGVKSDLQISNEVEENISKESYESTAKDYLTDNLFVDLSAEGENELNKFEASSTARPRRDIPGTNCRRVVYRRRKSKHYTRWQCT